MAAIKCSGASLGAGNPIAGHSAGHLALMMRTSGRGLLLGAWRAGFEALLLAGRVSTAHIAFGFAKPASSTTVTGRSAAVATSRVSATANFPAGGMIHNNGAILARLSASRAGPRALMAAW